MELAISLRLITASAHGSMRGARAIRAASPRPNPLLSGHVCQLAGPSEEEDGVTQGNKSTGKVLFQTPKLLNVGT